MYNDKIHLNCEIDITADNEKHLEVIVKSLAKEIFSLTAGIEGIQGINIDMLKRVDR